MISSRIVQLLTIVVISVPVICASEDRPVNSIISLQPSKSHRTVKEKTIIVPSEVLKRWRGVRLAVIDKARGTENIYVIPIGTTFIIPSSSLSITVEAFLPAFTIEGATITSSSNELLNPGAKVKISENGTPVFLGWLFSNFPNRHAVSHPKYGFSLIGVISAHR